MPKKSLLQPTPFTLALQAEINRTPTSEELKRDSQTLVHKLHKPHEDGSSGMEDNEKPIVEPLTTGGSSVKVITPEESESRKRSSTFPEKTESTDDKNKSEFPEAGTTKHLLGKFKAAETEAQMIKEREMKPSGIASQPSIPSARPTPTVIHASYRDNVEDYEELAGGGVFESQPSYREDVVRELDRNDEQELPPVGLTRNLLSTFKQMERKEENQWQAKTPKETQQETRETQTKQQIDGSQESNEIVKEDGKYIIEEELPEAGMARNLLEKYKTIESETKILRGSELMSSAAGNKSTLATLRSMANVMHASKDKMEEYGKNKTTCEVQTSSRTAPAVIHASYKDNVEDFEELAGGGVFESQPLYREDVVREQDRNDEQELPPVGLTKNLLSAFKQMERSGENSPKQMSRAASSNSILSEGHPCNKITPEQRGDVVREADRNDEQELPPVGLTRNLLSTFKQMERSGENTPRQISRVASSSSSLSEMVFSYQGQSAFENTPEFRGDIAREADRSNEEELPTQGTAKNLLSVFKQKAEEEKVSNKKLHQPSGAGQRRWKPKNQQVAQTSTTRQQADVPHSSSFKTKENGQRFTPNRLKEEDHNKTGAEITRKEIYQEQSQEIAKEDGCYIIEDELPKSGFAKNLLHQFKAMEKDSGSNITLKVWAAPALAEKTSGSAATDNRCRNSPIDGRSKSEYQTECEQSIQEKSSTRTNGNIMESYEKENYDCNDKNSAAITTESKEEAENGPVLNKGNKLRTRKFNKKI